MHVMRAGTPVEINDRASVVCVRDFKLSTTKDALTALGPSSRPRPLSPLSPNRTT